MSNTLRENIRSTDDVQVPIDVAQRSNNNAVKTGINSVSR